MRKIILYGELGKRFGREHTYAVRSASEAIQALCANFHDFRVFMKDAHKFGVGFKVFVGNNSLRAERDTILPSSDRETIRIAPAVFGSGGFVKLLIGAALILTGAGAFGIGTIISTGVSQAITSIGISVALGGLYQLLASPPEPPAGPAAETQSYIFSGPENVTRQGGAVPVGYGRMMIGSTVISAGIEDKDQ